MDPLRVKVVALIEETTSTVRGFSAAVAKNMAHSSLSAAFKSAMQLAEASKSPTPYADKLAGLTVRLQTELGELAEGLSGISGKGHFYSSLKSRAWWAKRQAKWGRRRMGIQQPVMLALVVVLCRGVEEAPESI